MKRNDQEKKKERKKNDETSVDLCTN